MWLSPARGRGAARRLSRISIAAGLALGIAACGGDEAHDAGAGDDRPPPQVRVIVAERTDVDVVEDYAGRVRGAREVEVRARVEGILGERLYEEGQYVDRGAPLFSIEQQPFAVALQGARAERESAVAELRRAEREWERASRLFERGTIAESARDDARSTLELARARLAMADAVVARADMEIGYTNVTAPVTGITSLEAVPEGSLVDRGSLLTTIIQQDPIHVRFALPEDDAALQRAARRAMVGGQEALDLPRQAVLVLPDGSEYEQAGRIDFTASSIDPATGTVSARAVFPNPDNIVVPGQFVRIRLILQTLEGVVVAPEVAVGEGPTGARVFVVDADDIARARGVRLGPVVEDGQVILDGIEDGDRVIVSGQVAVQPDTPVEVLNASEDGDGGTAAVPSIDAREGRG